MEQTSLIIWCLHALKKSSYFSFSQLFYELLYKILALSAVSRSSFMNLKLKFVYFSVYLNFYEEKQADGRSESDAMLNVCLIPNGSFWDLRSYCFYLFLFENCWFKSKLLYPSLACMLWWSCIKFMSGLLRLVYDCKYASPEQRAYILLPTVAS